MKLNLTKWDPFEDMGTFQNRLDSIFGGLACANGNHLSQWAPAVDVAETDKEYEIKLELPGLKREEVQVTLENGILTVKGERKLEKEEKEKNYHRVERSYGTFSRSFTLPAEVEAEKVAAEFTDGVLNVNIPKSEKALPRQIEVKIK